MNMNTKIVTGIVFVLAVAGLGYGYYFYKNNINLGPIILDPTVDITEAIPPSEPITPPPVSPGTLLPPAGNPPPAPSDPPKPPVNNTQMPLKLPAGFEISIFASNLPGARDMALDGLGNMIVSQTGQGKISLLYIKNGIVDEQTTLLSGLNRPHGVAIHPQQSNLLYFAEQNKISKVPLYSEPPPEKVVDLPSGGHHTNYSLRFGPDDRLYVALGSTCDVCNEADKRRGTIQVVDLAKKTLSTFALGLRNAPFFTWSYIDGRMWATEMGRDFLGDNLPPDEINIVQHGKDYGWPNCYGKNVHDGDFDKNNQASCSGKVPSHVDLQAHSAPLGLGFIPEEGWPEEYWHDLIVAYHGSWNRSIPTGYKLVHIKLDAKGNYEGTEDFITGWLPASGGGALGRPAGVLIQPGGTMYVSDDGRGVIYRIRYNRE